MSPLLSYLPALVVWLAVIHAVAHLAATEPAWREPERVPTHHTERIEP